MLVSPIADSLPSEAKVSSMSLLHSFYSWGQVLVILLSTPALFLVGQDLWHLLPLVWTALPLFTLIRFTKVPFPPKTEKSRQTPLKTLFRSKIFLLALLLMVCSGAAEQAMAQWASLFAEKGLGISKTLGDLLGPCLFAVMMGIMRTWYGIKGRKTDIHGLLIVCSALCIASFALAGLARSPAPALLGCALCGLSVALMWPGMLSVTAAGYPLGGVSMFAILAVGGDIGCSIGPQLTGIVADGRGLSLGLLSAIIFPAVLLVGLLVLKPLLASKREKDADDKAETEENYA